MLKGEVVISGFVQNFAANLKCSANLYKLFMTAHLGSNMEAVRCYGKRNF